MVHDDDFLVIGHLVPASACVVDVGANTGQSIKSIRAVLPKCTIHSFELNPELHRDVEKITERDPKVHFYPFGLGDAEKVVTFYVPSWNGTRYLEETTLDLAEFRKPWVIDRWKQRGGGPMIEERQGIVKRGDDFHFLADLIKIDVEGAELSVVAGFVNTIKRRKPIILVENSDFLNVTPFLQQFGYAPMMANETKTGVVSLDRATTNTFYVQV